MRVAKAMHDDFDVLFVFTLWCGSVLQSKNLRAKFSLFHATANRQKTPHRRRLMEN